MDLFGAWLLGPLLVLIATIGLSLIVERLAGFAVAWPLRPGLGLAAMIVLAQFGTISSATAELTLPATFALGALGIVLGMRRLERPGAAGIAAAVVVFALLAAPFVVSGQATWAGYLKLDDSATWMAIGDHAFADGRGIGGLPPSTHEVVLDMYLGKGYPIGGFVPAAAVSWVSGQDIAFTLQPAMALAAVALALALFELIRRPLASDAVAAAIAVVASLSAILLGYYLWAESKELTTAALLALAPALAKPARRGGWPPGAYVPFGVTIGALIAVLGPGGLVWLVAPLVAILAVVVRERGGQLATDLAGRTMLLTVVLAIPVLVTPEGLFNPLDRVLTEPSETSTLGDALNPLQVAGLWPATDFRADPHLEPLVVALAALCLVLAAGAVVACARLPDRAGFPFAAYVGGSAIGAALIMVLGSPWVDGKAMAILSPAVLSAALVALAMLARRRSLRLPALATGAAITAVVAWSAFLAYQGASLAPRDQYEELERIGERFAGEGPALATDTSFYGARHFLSELAPESPLDFHPRSIALSDGSLVGPKTRFVDVGDVAPESLQAYRLLVLPRSPGTSRPPSAFELAYRGDYYEVWRRVAEAPLPDAVLALGSLLDAGGVADCGRVRALSGDADGGGLEAAPVTDPVTVPIGDGTLPSSWRRLSPWSVDAAGSGRASAAILTGAGRYDVLVGGNAYGRATVEIDGHEVGSERGGVYPTGDYRRVGTVELGQGRHEAALDYEGASAHPGSAVPADPLGPVLLDPVAAPDSPTVRVGAADYRRLCDRRWDWIQAYQS